MLQGKTMSGIFRKFSLVNEFLFCSCTYVAFYLFFLMHVIKNKLYGFSFNVEIIWAVVFRKEIKLCSCSGFTHVWVV